MRSLVVAAGLLAARVLAQQEWDDNPCQSFGIDFQDGRSYFQNVLSTDNFTALQEFEGCSGGDAYNILVDPSGNQYYCNNSPLTPPDTPQLIVCPVQKNQLTSGDWSILVLANNADDGEPIAYMRDFYLTVGPQITDVVTPTVTATNVFTPVVSFTNTITQVITSTAKPATKTVPKIALLPTVTKIPLPVISVVTRALVTVTSTVQLPAVQSVTSTVAPSCSLQEQSRIADPLATIVATILSELGLAKRDASPAPTAMPGMPAAGDPVSAKFKRAVLEGRAVEEELRDAFLAVRHERLVARQLEKRAPDAPTVTSTADAVSTTYTITAPTTSITGTTTLVETTVTTSTVTVSSGIAVGATTVTAVAITLYNTFWVPATTVFNTATVPAIVTVAATSSNAAFTSSCAAAGGTPAA